MPVLSSARQVSTVYDPLTNLFALFLSLLWCHPLTTCASGKAAVLEAIDALKTKAPVSARALTVHEGMSKAAADHAADLVNSGNRLGHTGSDGSHPADRISRYGRWFERASECLAYRHTSAPMLVTQLVVDDGSNPNRAQRNTILSPEMRAVGLAVTNHPQHGVLAVLTFAGGFGPQPLDVDVVVEAQGGVDPLPRDFLRVLDSIPVVAVHEQVEAALARNDKVELNYQPGALKMTVWSAADGNGQMYGVEWGN